jgi:6-pyruvoyltetrahydropterin/6-carboxytetrahydropterin synthase
MNYRNLDEAPEFAGRNTTTEFLAREIFDRIAIGIEEGQLGPNTAGLSSMRVTCMNLMSPGPPTRDCLP